MDPLLAAYNAMDQAELRRARAELMWHQSEDSLERYCAYQAALAGLVKAAELYWDARRKHREQGEKVNVKDGVVFDPFDPDV